MRIWARQIVDSYAFRVLVPAMIVLFSILIGVELSVAPRDAPTPPVWVALDWAFSLFFLGEIALRLAAQPMREFFGVLELNPREGDSPRWALMRMQLRHDAFWNVFDLVIVAISCTSLIAHFFPHPEFLFTARLLRATRVMLLLGMTQRLRRIEEHIIAVIPTVFNFVLLLSILVYMYAVIGSHLFGDIPMPDPGFATVPKAFLTMFQILTLDGWTDLMRLVGATHPIIAPMFFVSFIGLTAIIMLNVFIAVLTNELQLAFRRDSAAERVALGVADIQHDVDHLHADVGELRDTVATARTAEARITEQLVGIGDRLDTLHKIIESQGD